MILINAARVDSKQFTFPRKIYETTDFSICPTALHVTNLYNLSQSDDGQWHLSAFLPVDAVLQLHLSLLGICTCSSLNCLSTLPFEEIIVIFLPNCRIDHLKYSVQTLIFRVFSVSADKHNYDTPTSPSDLALAWLCNPLLIDLGNAFTHIFLYLMHVLIDICGKSVGLLYTAAFILNQVPYSVNDNINN